MDSETDVAVISASLGAPARFAAIFDRHATVIHRYLVRRIGPADADELLGETFRVAFEKRASFDVERVNARPWLYGIATNLLAKHRRSEARRVRAIARLGGQRTISIDPADTAIEPADAADRLRRVADAITRLPESDRDVVVLFVWEGLAYDDIATALSIPVGTVRSRLHRVRRHLRELDDATGKQQMTPPTPPGAPSLGGSRDG